MKKNIYTEPSITVYETITDTEILAGSLPKGDEPSDLIDDEEEILSKPVAPTDINLWEDDEF